MNSKFIPKQLGLRKIFGFAILLSAVLFAVPIQLLGQNTTTKYPKETLAERTRKIAQATKANISFDSKQTGEKTVAALNVELTDANQLLELSLQGSGFKLKKVSKDTYIILADNKNTVKQKQQITGVVVDQVGEPIVGATVMDKEASTATITDNEGQFKLNVAEGDKLFVTFLGYRGEEFFVDQKKNYRIQLKDNNQALNEVVVVGYGTTQKKNLVGAVSQIDGLALNNKSSMNVTRSLQGVAPGLNISMYDGKPTRGATLNIRGTGSIGAGGSPLILVDGAECDGDMTSISPDDIESVSVLKDASSSAIYGARGAFGVILITTKKVKAGAPSVTYNGSFSVHKRLSEPDIVSNGLDWTNGWYNAYKEGMDNGSEPNSINNVFKYNTEWYNELVKRNNDPTLEKVRVNSNGEYEYFGNTNWFDIIYKDYNSSQVHNVSVSGGSDKVKYFVSGRYFSQDGIYTAGNEQYKQYNFRAKGQIELTKKLVLDNSTDFISRSVHQPMVMYDRQNITRQLEHQGYPMTMPKNPDGTWTETAVYTGWAGFVEGTSYQENAKFDLRNTVGLTYTPIKDQLIIKGDFTYFFNHSARDRVENMYDYYTGPAIKSTRNTFSSLEHYSYDKRYISSNLTANYIPKFSNADHYLNVLGGINLEEKDYTSIQTYRRGLILASKPSFALMDGDYYTVNQSGNGWSYLGFLFRADYNYQGKYLAQVSGRYDGSSKFPNGQQWGFFPSFSGGWRISQENFMASTKSWLDNLKVRASVGSLGNGNVDPYLYMSTLNINKTNVIIDGKLQSYTVAPANTPESLTWETSTTYDIGLDLSVLNSRLSLVADYYNRYTTNMYTPGTRVPAVFGADVPKGNNAELLTKGWELTLEWKDRFQMGKRPFNYSVKAMLWDNRSWIEKYNNPNKLLTTYYEGMEIGEIWGYHIEGLFTDQDDINTHADQSAIRVSTSNILKSGDLKFGDLDNNDVINNGENTKDNPGDQRIIGNALARYNFGINLSGNWKGFGLSVFLQGVGKQNWYPAKESAFFWGQYNRPYSYMLTMHTGDNVWTEENQNADAYWPRYRGYLASSSNRSMSVTNDRYLQNIAYIRLKSMQIDYSFSQKVCEALKINKLKVYLAGDNLWTWSPLYKVTRNFDPEATNAGDPDFRSTSGSDGDGYGYPMLSSYTIGLNITF